MPDQNAIPNDPGVADIVPMREVDPDKKIPYDVLRYIPQESAEHYRIAPLSVQDGVLEVGVVDPNDLAAVDALNFIAKSTGLPFKLFQITPIDFDAILKMYKGLGGEVDMAVTDLQTEQNTAKTPIIDAEATPLDLDTPNINRHQTEMMESFQEDAPAVKIASTILRYAIDGRASDIHIEPQANGVRVRYRIDGELHTSVVLPPNTHRALVARIKVLASIRLDERRKPQDGRFSASIDGRGIDFRVSTFPAYYGEKVVIRILDRSRGFVPFADLGLSERNARILRKAISQPHGIILISGPTGSGKSTTLYSLLNELDREKKNVLSLEDPIEYFIEGVAQSQVRPEIGYTFANGLRTTLRQDPDIIMVGEIRDSETAQLAIQAALTGHLVLSTIHTNDAVGTVTRLINMGVERYLIPPVLVASIAQRLVRTFADESAAKEAELSPSEMAQIESQLRTLPEQHRFPVSNKIWEPQKTEKSLTGLRGRQAVFEVMEMNSEIEHIILEDAVESKLWDASRRQGMLTMREDAIQKAFAKRIPYSEVNSLSTLLMDEDEAPAPTAPAAQPVSLEEV